MIGLTSKEASENLRKFGYNEISESSLNSPFKILLRQIRSNYIIYLLTVATIISFIVGKDITGYTILAVIFIVIFVGFFMEYRAEKSIAALKGMVTQTTIAFRDGREVEVEVKELVPGDVILLRTGDKVPADGYILEQKDLRVNESMLTGESKEVHKTVANVSNEFEDKHRVFMGTFVVNGHCKVCIMHTGMNTEFGKIAGMISHAQKDIPLQKKINKIIKYMSINAVFFAIITGMVMLVRETTLTYELFIEILIVVVALSVAAFPEGFPVVLVTTLAAGARKMASKNAIVNRMAIIETLGETTIICSDKTGTITKGEMTVRKLFLPDVDVSVGGIGYVGVGDFLVKGKKIFPERHPGIKELLKAGIVCNDATIQKHLDRHEYKIRGSQTEAALLILGSKAELFKDSFSYTVLEEIPFNSQTKYMATIIKEKKAITSYVKGAPEVLLDRCKKYVIKNKSLVLTEKKKQEFLAVVNSYASKSYRVLAIASKKLSKNMKDPDNDLVFLGFAILEDPVRDEVVQAVADAQKSGIAVKILTGDNKNTAIAVAKQIGLKGEVVEGIELDNLSDKELSVRMSSIAVFARVRPDHKIRIVRVLKENGDVVSMTGDGVNDAPALKEAHIGIAMGKNGTDVSREVSDLILKDDNFATIVSAIGEGRTIFKNIQKVSVYQISITLAQIGFIFIAIMLGFPLPLVAMQILFINLLSDEITAIMLGFNPPSLDVMQKKPRKNSSIINPRISILLFLSTLIIVGSTLGGFLYAYNVLGTSLEVAQTFAFVIIVLFGVTSAFNFRSFRYPFTRLPLTANFYLLAASIVSILMTILVVYLPPLQKVFETVYLPPIYWAYAAGLSVLFLVIFDLFKFLNLRFKFLEVEE